MKNTAPLWHKAPFLRILPPFILGILWQDSAKMPFTFIATALTTSLFFSCCFSIRLLSTSYYQRWLVGICFNLLLVSTGMLFFRQGQVINHADWFAHDLPNSNYLIGSPEKIATTGKKTSRFQFKVMLMADQSGHVKKVTGSFIGYLPPEFSSRLLPGDIILFNAGALKEIRPTGNPGAFDFAKYSARQNIYHQAFFRNGQFKIIQTSNRFHLAKCLAIGQLSALQSMRETVPEKARGLAMALLIGYRNEVDKSLLQAYTNTGVVHVIAVSGMHLGLIFLLLQKLLLFPEKKYRLFKWIKAGIVLLIIWWFSGIAGSAASILRAAFMFSVALLSKLIRKPVDNIQSICIGAFALLCYNPLWLWDAGFQLSFAALLSIICYQPLITSWCSPKNPILKGIWDLTAVTLSAQVLTLPISIGQFHQAPVYFLAANLLAVPLSSIALITAILQWIISAAGFSNNFAGYITGFFIDSMNALIRHISSLPGAVINQIEWSIPQTILAYLITIFLTQWLIKPKIISRWNTLCAITCFGLLGLKQKIRQSKQEILLILHVQKQSAILIVQGTTLNVLNPMPAPTSVDQINAARFFQTNTDRQIKAEIVRYGQYIIAIPQSSNAILPLLEMNPDWLILPPDLKKPDPVLQKLPANTTIIIDGSIPEWKATQWTRFLREKGYRFYSTWDKGAIQIPINKF